MRVKDIGLRLVQVQFFGLSSSCKSTTIILCDIDKLEESKLLQPSMKVELKMIEGLFTGVCHQEGQLSRKLPMQNYLEA